MRCAKRKAVDICRQPGVSEASFYVWKKKYGKRNLHRFGGPKLHTR